MLCTLCLRKAFSVDFLDFNTLSKKIQPYGTFFLDTVHCYKVARFFLAVLAIRDILVRIRIRYL